MDNRILIKNAKLLTMADSQPSAGLSQVLIEDGSISAVGADLGVSDAKEIDAIDHIVMPGMVDTHRHVWQALLRAQLGDGTLYGYMARLRYGFAPRYSAEDAELGNYAGALDALNSGITTVVDHAHLVTTPEHGDALLTGLEKSGIRAVFCYGLADVFDPGELEDDLRAFKSTWRHEDAERLRKERLSGDSGLIRFGLGASEFLFAPLRYTDAEIALHRKLDSHLFSIHVANGPFARGTRYVTRLLNKGVIDDKTLLVHGNVLTNRDLARLAEVGAAVSATPETEMQMGMGTPIWPAALKQGVTVGLGADVVSGGSGDLFTQMRLALVAGRMAANDKIGAHGVMPARVALKAEDALKAATIGGARAAGLDKDIGSIEVGKQADLIFIRTDRPHMSPIFDPVVAVVMQAGVSDVDTVMVRGKIVKLDGRLTGVNQSEIAQKVQHAGERIISATPQQGIDHAYSYVDASFPLNRTAAFGARVAALALRIPGLNEVVFKKIHSHTK